MYVIDDDVDIRRSLHFLLTTRNAVATSFSSASDFLNAIDGLVPSPLLLDVRMPEMDGLQLIEELRRRDVAWPSIMLSGHGDVAIAVQALKLGASDFLEKPVVASLLEACLAQAFDQLDTQASTRQLKDRSSCLWALLTPRESSVLEHLCDGLSNKQVAYRLEISPRTVEMHRANALQRLQVKSLPEVMKLKNLLK